METIISLVLFIALLVGVSKLEGNAKTEEELALKEENEKYNPNRKKRKAIVVKSYVRYT